MRTVELDAVLTQLLPRVLTDRELGDGSTLTPLHVRHLWALACRHAGQYVDEAEVLQRVLKMLPAGVLLAQEVPD